MNESSPTLKLAEAAGQAEPVPSLPIQVELPTLDERLWNVRFRVHVKGEAAARPPNNGLMLGLDFNAVRAKLIKHAEKDPNIDYIAIESIVWTDTPPIFNF